VLAGPGAAAALGEAGIVVKTSDRGVTRRDTWPASTGGVAVLVGRAEPLAGGAFRLLTAAGDAAILWRALLAGSESLQPAGARAEEIIRIESGIPAAGHEVDERWNPLEVGLDEAISLAKGCYTEQEVIARLTNYDKVQRQLCHLIIEGEKAPSPGAEVRATGDDGDDAASQPIGVVTSATHSGAHEGLLAMALVDKAHAVAGDTVLAAGRPATIIGAVTRTRPAPDDRS
jgi:folate-binding protein YgfZ